MTSHASSRSVTLRVNLADHRIYAPLKTGDLRSDLVSFDFCGPKIAHRGFKAMVRDRAFDAGELALVTYMQARISGVPLVMLPATIVGKFQHHCIAYSSEHRRLEPKDIERQKVGVRAYSQTTGMWVRGILQHQYGIDLKKVTWCSHEEPHVAQTPDPDFVERFELGDRSLSDHMLAGHFAAAIVGNDFPDDPRARHLIPDPVSASQKWYEIYNAVQVNHVFVVDSSLADQRPDVVEEVYRLLRECKRRAVPAATVDTFPFGAAELESSLALAAQYAHEQDLLPRALPTAELFSEMTRRLV